MNPNPIDVDSRWTPYLERFESTPEYYFSTDSGLEFPENKDSAAQQLQKLNAEIEAIGLQFTERETELKVCKQNQIELRTLEYNEWKIKALRAQRMRMSQIRILQAWVIDNVPTVEERVSYLESEVESLKLAVHTMSRNPNKTEPRAQGYY